MTTLITTPNLDKDLLVRKIVEQFLQADALIYKRPLLEFFDDQGRFIGDNLFETTFKLRPDQAPLIYEVSGPYDTVSKEYATIAKVYHRGELVFQFDLKPGIIQRTAAMVWIYLDVLKHKIGKVLLIGAGKVGKSTAEYLKHFTPDLNSIDYQDVERKIVSFEDPLRAIGIQAKYVESPEFSQYDTIIMATTTNRCLVNEENISSIRAGSAVVSLCTTSQSGEIAKEIYGRGDVNVFLDYDLSKTFTEDMKKVNELGYLDNVYYLKDLIKGEDEINKEQKINIIRLTGTPMQNIAVIDILFEKK